MEWNGMDEKFVVGRAFIFRAEEIERTIQKVERAWARPQSFDPCPSHKCRAALVPRRGWNGRLYKLLYESINAIDSN